MLRPYAHSANQSPGARISANRWSKAVAAVAASPALGMRGPVSRVADLSPSWANAFRSTPQNRTLKSTGLMESPLQRIGIARRGPPRARILSDRLLLTLPCAGQAASRCRARAEAFLVDVVLDRLANCLVEISGGRPAQIAFRGLDSRHAHGDVLIVLAVVLTR